VPFFFLLGLLWAMPVSVQADGRSRRRMGFPRLFFLLGGVMSCPECSGPDWVVPSTALKYVT
jgi:hypothetical protein